MVFRGRAGVFLDHIIRGFNKMQPSIGKKTSIIILFIVFLIFNSCATSPTGRSQVIFVSDSDMIEMGIQSFQNLKKEKRIETGGAINRYVRCVANAITAHANDPTGVKSWEVVVFRDASANAFALPGGKIGVFTGLFQVARNADQLAAVIGHEVAHVIARHSHERVTQNLGTQKGMSVLDSFLGGENKKIILGAIGLGAQYGVLLPFSRVHEREADEIGQELMAKAGFDPRQSVVLWQNMSELAGGKEPPELISTHPSSGSRINDLKREVKKTLPVYIALKSEGRIPECKVP